MEGDRIKLAGKTYISSAQAARETKYTKDYIGQLARAGKIDAKLIGRSWYVAEESLMEHKQSVHYTLTKAKKPRAHKVSREPEKATEDIDISDEVHLNKNVEIPSHERGQVDEVYVENALPSSTAPTEETTTSEARATSAVRAPAPPSITAGEPVQVPIRTEKKVRSRDALLSSHIEYEPGEALYFDDTRPYRSSDAPRVARFGQTPIVHHVHQQRSVPAPRSHMTQCSEAPLRSHVMSARPAVRMDGVVMDTRSNQRKQTRSSPPLARGAQSVDTDSADISNYGRVERRTVRRARRVPWLLLLVAGVLVSGFGAIVWVLFGF